MHLLSFASGPCRSHEPDNARLRALVEKLNFEAGNGTQQINVRWVTLTLFEFWTEGACCYAKYVLPEILTWFAESCQYRFAGAPARGYPITKLFRRCARAQVASIARIYWYPTHWLGPTDIRINR
jgi:hypothetical protein